MKRVFFLFSFLFFSLSVYGADLKFAVPVNANGNPVLNVSTFTFNYGEQYSTMSVKLDEIAKSTTDAQTHFPDWHVSTSTLRINGNCWVMGLYGFEK